MPAPPDDDPAADWPDDAPATTVDLLPDDLAELEREETTPTAVPDALPGFDVGRRAGIYEMIADVRAVFTEARNSPNSWRRSRSSWRAGRACRGRRGELGRPDDQRPANRPRRMIDDLVTVGQ